MMQLYKLDHSAQKIVLDVLKRSPDSLNQVYKMRMTIPYGLERFWGESLRLDASSAIYWKETWAALVEILGKAELKIPSGEDQSGNAVGIESMARQLWNLPIEDQRVAIAVLTQLCDCIVWWTQRYKNRLDDL